MTSSARTASGGVARLAAWRFIMVFGVVSMLMDVVYEGARSVTGPLLAGLGASGLVVGVVTGVGEAAALGFRLVSGPLADRSGRFWTWTIAGYLVTAAVVPLTGLPGVLWATALLVIGERVGKAVRSPAKDTLVSHAATVTGRGKGFAIHEALDQIGALLGPLLVAAMLAVTGDNYAPALGVLAIPGAASVALVVWLSRRVPDPVRYEADPPAGSPATASDHLTPPGSLPRAYWIYAGFTAATMVGFATFGLLSFHLVREHVMPTAVIPVAYAGAMGADALAALATGWLYDRIGPWTLVALPVLAAVSPVLAFTAAPWSAVTGILLWGAAVGIQESTLRATVADLVPPGRRATAYGVYAAILGAATFLGGVLTGWLYDTSPTLLVLVVAGVQVCALLLLLATRPAGLSRSAR
ncbi:MFS transporter [Raineyella sp. W15-4]|uniref:MFS transporter n=1 Tax=Raineyella sp. W15-4 TaxID=3081651 RepID=UPI002955A795|nr:MFS transporter [Raineyella sp. W15-4]WOQ16693.1 MFS transporter [Raineyella sp. W15-4]